MATEIIKLPPFNNGDILGGIFKYQENLMLEYIGMDMLSPFPIELNNRESQRFMKGLIGDIIEELVEANNHYRTEILEFYNEWGHAVIPGSPAFNVEQYQKLR